MSSDPLVLVSEVDRATTRLLDTATALDADPAVPSLLPGWTRGHLLTHVARNADAMVNLLTWARTGVVTPGYPSPAHRAAGIEAGAGRSWDLLLADVRATHERFLAAAEELSAERWLVELDTPPGPPRPAAFVAWRRLREVEMHHVDLAAGYTPRDWPESFAHRVLHEVAGGLPGVSLTLHPEGLGHPVPVGAGGPPDLHGTGYALAAWLTGRSPGTDLTVEPSGTLPAIPDWM